MTNLVISGAGAIIGGMIGGPTGAQLGWMAGSVIAGVANPEHINQRTVGDLKVQTAQFGAPIAYIMGKQRVAPNIIWADEKKEYPIKKRQGKGGPVVTTSGYTISMAMGLCAGPIIGVSKVWANEKLIVNASADTKKLVGTLYLGTTTQMPDPTMEGILGSGNVPAYRGLAYLVLTNFDITGYGGVVPQFSFEVVRGATV